MNITVKPRSPRQRVARDPAVAASLRRLEAVLQPRFAALQLKQPRTYAGRVVNVAPVPIMVARMEQEKVLSPEEASRVREAMRPEAAARAASALDAIARRFEVE